MQYQRADLHVTYARLEKTSQQQNTNRACRIESRPFGCKNFGCRIGTTAKNNQHKASITSQSRGSVEKEQSLALMPDVLRCRGVNGVFGDVGRMITDAFQTARD